MKVSFRNTAILFCFMAISAKMEMANTFEELAVGFLIYFGFTNCKPEV
ncbi:MAG: hypothetical protein IPP71_01315 [Bacteroidetes bacterium]|nr:hypothetical protein [Bacteroidota bacterium]